MLRQTWSGRGVHFTTDQTDYYTSYRAAIVAVSSTVGIVSYQIYDTAVNEEIFLAFLDKLSLTMGEEPFALFMDRLIIHRMITVKERMRSRDIFPIYNCPAAPDFNAIETCFA